MTKAPAPLTVPPVTRSPAPFSTGTGSPVTIDSSTALRPSRTAPSTGTRSPGRTRRRSPTPTRSSGTSSSRPSSRRTRAVAGASPSSARMAPLVRLRARSSRTWPEKHQHGDHRRHLEVEAHLTGVTAHSRREEAWRQRGGHAVGIRGARAEPDQREHVGAPVHEGRPGALEERPAAPQHHGGRERRAGARRGRGGRRRAGGVGPGSGPTSRRPTRGRSRPARPRTGASCPGARGSPPPRASTVLGSRAMPQIGQAPGSGPHDLGMHRADPLGARRRRLEIDRFECHAARRTGARRRQADLGVHGARVVAGSTGRRGPGG